MKDLKILDSCTHEDLIKYGFKKCKGKSYMYTVPVYTYKDIIVIEAKFLAIPEEKDISYDVIDSNSNLLYTAFYDRKYSNPNDNKVLAKVIDKINRELKLMKEANIISSYKGVS